MRKTDPLLAKRPALDSPVPDDEEPTRPIPLELIARLAAQDPTVQLKIGVIQILEQKADEEEKTTGH